MPRRKITKKQPNVPMVEIKVSIPLKAWADYLMQLDACRMEHGCKEEDHTPESHLARALCRSAAWSRAEREQKEANAERKQRIVDIIKKLSGGKFGDGAEVYNPFEHQETCERADEILKSYFVMD